MHQVLLYFYCIPQQKCLEIVSQTQSIYNCILISYQFSMLSKDHTENNNNLFLVYKLFTVPTDLQMSITSKQTSLIYCLHFVGLPNYVVNMSNYTHYVDVRITGWEWKQSQPTMGTQHLAGEWRKTTKSLSLCIRHFRCNSSWGLSSIPF
jgi:hypothetical protein